MAIRTIRQEGDEILKKKSKPVEEFNKKIEELAKDMIETMQKYDGVGLAAVQVGVLRQVIVIDTGVEGEQFVIINPKILRTSGSHLVDEGCLSFPNKFGKVERPEKITIEAYDLNGDKRKIKGEGLLAQAIAHEIDHLNGEVFIDKVLPGTLEVITPEMKKENEENKE